MGDYILMKTLFLALCLFLFSNLLANELSWVDEQVEAIKPPRSGMRHSTISTLKNPFVFLEKNRTESVVAASKTKPTNTPATSIQKLATQKTATVKKVLTLNAVMNNSVMINGVWYKTGDSINSYTIKEITRSSALLVKNKKKLLLSTHSSSTKLKFLK